MTASTRVGVRRRATPIARCPASSATIRGAADVTVSVPARTITATSARAAFQSEPELAQAAHGPAARRPAVAARVPEPLDERPGPGELAGSDPAADRAHGHADELPRPGGTRRGTRRRHRRAARRAEERERRPPGEDPDQAHEVDAFARPQPLDRGSSIGAVGRRLDDARPPHPARTAARASRRSASWSGPSMLSSASGRSPGRSARRGCPARPSGTAQGR